MPAASRREGAVVLFELFPLFYLVSGFTLVAGATGTALFIVERRVRREERTASWRDHALRVSIDGVCDARSAVNY
jgi:hypothetical protein